MISAPVPCTGKFLSVWGFVTDPTAKYHPQRVSARFRPYPARTCYHQQSFESFVTPFVSANGWTAATQQVPLPQQQPPPPAKPPASNEPEWKSESELINTPRPKTIN
jgi:hypothetical protein